MLGQLHACHLASNTYLVGISSRRVRNCGRHHIHQATSGICSRSSTTAAAAEPPRRARNSEHASGLGALLRNNQLPQAVAVLESCLDSQKRVHGVPAGQLLEALCASGQHSTVWLLVRRITSAQGRLPLQVLHRLLKAAGQFGTVDDVLGVYEHQQQLYGFASAGVQTTLIHALLKAHSKARPGHLLAYEAWGRLRGSGKQLDAQALLAGIHACVCVGQFRQAEALLEPLKAAAGAAGKPVVSAYNLILKGHVAADNIDAARKAFGAMTSRGLAPDVVTYNTLLNGFVRSGDMVRARALVRTMQVEGIVPDAWTYSTLALGYGRLGQLQDMQEVVVQMQRAGVKPNSATYTAAIDSLASAGQLQQAGQLLQQLLDGSSHISFASAASSSSSSDDSSSGGSRATRDSCSNTLDDAAAQRSGTSDAGGSTRWPQATGTDLPVRRQRQQTVATVVSSSATALEDASIGRTFDSFVLASGRTAAGAASAAEARQPQRLQLQLPQQQQSQQPQQPTFKPAQQQQQQVLASKLPPPLQQQPQQQQQQQQPARGLHQQRQSSVVGSTRNAQQVLRQQYNSLIKGWLQQAADQASQEAEQQWLLWESGTSYNTSSNNSNGVGGQDDKGGTAMAGSTASEAPTGLALAAAASNTAAVVGNSSRLASTSIPAAAGTVGAAVANGQAAIAGTVPIKQPLSQQQQQRVRQVHPPLVQAAGGGLLRPVLPPQPLAAAATAADQEAMAAVSNSHDLRQPQLQPQSQQLHKPVAVSDLQKATLPSAQASPAAANGAGASSSTVLVVPAVESDPFRAALGVLQQMVAAGVSPAADTYTLFIDHCTRVGDAGRLQQMLDAARAAGVVPDQVMLTSMIKAAWQADAPGTVLEVFNALQRVTGPPGRHRPSSRSSNSSSTSGSSSSRSSGSVSQGSSPAGSSVDGSVRGSSSGDGNAYKQGQAPLQQQQQQFQLAHTLRSYAQAAVAADVLQQWPGSSSSSSPNTGGKTQQVTTAADASEAEEQLRQQAAMQLELQEQLQQEVRKARGEQQQQRQEQDGVPDDLLQQQQQQQQRPRSRQGSQLLLPLSAPTGPDTAAWNALIAALVKARRLDDAAAALERSSQASAAAGACRPPVEGYSAVIRGYRRAGMKHKAVAVLRQFLNLGGRPGRVMCDDVITLCLEAKDVRTARQVVRAMELTGCLDADSSGFYDGWFTRWELQQQQGATTGLRPTAAAASGAWTANASSMPGQGPGSMVQQPPGSSAVAVERLKWWLGLPNSYYRREGAVAAGDGGAAGPAPGVADRE